MEPVDQPVLQERFAGLLLESDEPAGADGPAGGPRELAPALAALAHALLAPGGAFHAALARAYGASLAAHARHLLTLRSMALSGGFVLDAGYRADALEALCAACFETAGFLLVHPPSLAWQARDPQAAFRLHRLHDRDLALCTLFGEIGFGQLCDDRLGLPVPLLVRPWSRERGLLQPLRLPRKTFSQTLCVDRVGPRQLLLFDRRAP